MYDFANSAFATVVVTTLFSKYFAGVVADGGQPVHLFGYRLPGATLWSFTISLSLLLVAVSSPILGAVADRLGRKKRFLAFYCYGGCLFTALLALLGPGDYLLGMTIFTLANVGFEGGIVFYNAFLPQIAPAERMGRVSGWGWASGYPGGGLCLLLALALISVGGQDLAANHLNLRLTFVLSALWWAIFAIPTFLLVQERPGTPAAPARAAPPCHRWAVLRSTWGRVAHFPELLKFLLAFLLYNDGIETVIVMASIFGDQILHMDSQELILYFLVIQGTAFFGSLLCGYLADRLGNKQVIMVTLVVWCIILAWSYRLQTKMEYYLVGLLAGMILGGSQAASRSLLGLLTPSGQSAEFFGFYAVSGKLSSVIGPLIYGMIIWFTGDLRLGILSLLPFFGGGLGLLAFVDEVKGIREAREAGAAYPESTPSPY